jgi:hypothetical protein
MDYASMKKKISQEKCADFLQGAIKGLNHEN